MVTRLPGEIGAVRPLAACATAETIGVAAELTVAVKVADVPESRLPFCPLAKATTCICTFPALDGRQLPCQMPFPIWTMVTESLFEKVAFTLALWPLAPMRLPRPSVTCTSIVVACPTAVLNDDWFGCGDRNTSSKPPLPQLCAWGTSPTADVAEFGQLSTAALMLSQSLERELEHAVGGRVKPGVKEVYDDVYLPRLIELSIRSTATRTSHGRGAGARSAASDGRQSGRSCCAWELLRRRRGPRCR